MTIGEALKEEREKLNMSKSSFSKGIVDRKFYGKVENNEGTLSSKKLVELLFLHQIDINDFFEKVRSEYSNQPFVKKEDLEQEMRQAFNCKDTAKSGKIRDRILQLQGDNILKLRAIVACAYLEGRIKTLDSKIKDQIFEELDKHENLSGDISAIRLFSNVMPVLTKEQLNILMRCFLRKVTLKEKMTDLEKKRVAIVINNYLCDCYERQNKSDLVDESEEVLINLNDLDILIYKQVGTFYFELIKENTREAKAIATFLEKMGYINVAQNLKRYL